MATKREITKKHAREYATASKKERGRILDALVATTGWSRANARRQLTAAKSRKGPARAVKPALPAAMQRVAAARAKFELRVEGINPPLLESPLK